MTLSRKFIGCCEIGLQKYSVKSVAWSSVCVAMKSLELRILSNMHACRMCWFRTTNAPLYLCALLCRSIHTQTAIRNKNRLCPALISWVLTHRLQRCLCVCEILKITENHSIMLVGKKVALACVKPFEKNIYIRRCFVVMFFIPSIVLLYGIYASTYSLYFFVFYFFWIQPKRNARETWNFSQ